MPYYHRIPGTLATFRCGLIEFGTDWNRKISFLVPTSASKTCSEAPSMLKKHPCDLWNSLKRAPDRHLSKSLQFSYVSRRPLRGHHPHLRPTRVHPPPPVLYCFLSFHSPLFPTVRFLRPSTRRTRGSADSRGLRPLPPTPRKSCRRDASGDVGDTIQKLFPNVTEEMLPKK